MGGFLLSKQSKNLERLEMEVPSNKWIIQDGFT